MKACIIAFAVAVGLATYLWVSYAPPQPPKKEAKPAVPEKKAKPPEKRVQTENILDKERKPNC
jgi:hypothetical protein